jgi:hypothetical protein
MVANSPFNPFQFLAAPLARPYFIAYWAITLGAIVPHPLEAVKPPEEVSTYYNSTYPK